ncbi:glycoside hydrolase family 6 protein [Oligoflexus tunisiensis]|uniref:glycoside hydrolase family 6 protein n=1 Tax=Oligoflexus tunisiensis TaxID=708132 RepID=UPI00114CDBC5|nr:glycoside hydrolase family 6 protein [Oligoflexus tunisiensis]
MKAIRRELCLVLWLLACESTPEPETMTAPGPEIKTTATQAPAGVATAPAAVPTPEPEPAAEEPGSRQFWVDPKREVVQAAARLQATEPREAEWLRQLAEQPTAVWFTIQTTNPLAAAGQLAQAVAGSNRYAVAVIKALPHRDCMRYTTRGLDPEAYRLWIRDLVKGLGETPIYWILEPEALLLTGCLKPEEINARLALIAETVLVLKTNSKAQVYIGSGYPGWLTVDEAAARLVKAGVMAADGFALNVGQYHATPDCIQYGQEIVRKMGGKAFVIDTSRNGRGALPQDSWCNPKNRAIGEWPQAPTAIEGLDAYLWLKQPGESDGSCNGGPAAGVWWEAKAIELMRNAVHPPE